MFSMMLRRALLSSSSSPQFQLAVHLSSAINCQSYIYWTSFLSPFSRSYAAKVEQHRLGDEEKVADSISAELLKDQNSDTPSLHQRLDLHFSHITLSPSLLLTALNRSPNAGRQVIEFLQWLKSRPRFTLDDTTLSYFITYLGRRKDFKAIHDILVETRGISRVKCFETYLDRLVRAGRGTKAVSLFDRMEKDYGFPRDKESLRLVVSKLCNYGHGSYAEKMVKTLADEFFPDENICDMLVKGWCVDEKLDEARRLAGEMYRGGFEIGTIAYNAILDCVCNLCRKKDPFRIHSEVGKILVDMESSGAPRDVETFNVLIRNFCKIRMTDDALKLFYDMGQWDCCPSEATFLILIRSLFQAARIGEGHEMIDRMRSAGYGEYLDRKAYYGFMKILCGIERIDQAMDVYEMMKKDGHQPGLKTYDLLMGKLCAHGRVGRANTLFTEAKGNGVPVEPKAYKVDPRFAKKPKTEKKVKKRETLPEKMARKRRRLKQIRLSFVRPSKRRMRRAF